jgi:outer membrane protein OmpA-like peptidoglycan-associated protein/osmotically-inducible protein OsmY
MNWQRWIRPGLIVTFIMAGLALALRDGSVERDIGGRVTAELAAQGLAWASADVSARDVTLHGMAPSVEAQQQAVVVASKVRGVRAVADASDLLPIVSPYVWSAKRDGRSVTLTGAVPSEGSRAAILAAARRAMPDAEIHDSMQLGRGAPPTFNSAATFSLVRLAALGDGVVTLTDSTLAVSGTAASAQAYADARAAFSEQLPAAVTLGPVDVLPARADPFVFSASFDGKAVTLVGFVPNDIVHKTLVATTKATLPGVPISDTVVVASGDPPGFAEAASFAIAQLDRMRDGGVTLDGLNLDVAGTAKSVDDYEALLENLSTGLPQGMKLVSAAVAPAVASPYGWSAEKTADAVVLSGYVPSADGHDEVIATARIVFAGATIDDRIRVAAGEPRMDWIGAIKFAMGELARLSHGKVAIGDQSYSVEGEAASAEAYGQILDANSRTLPASLSLVHGAVTPPRVTPFRFVAERRGAGIAMSGYVPDEPAREAIFAAAHRKFGSVEISGDLVFAAGAPDGFVDAVTASLQALSRLAGGYVAVVDNAVTVQGLVYQPGAIGDITDTLSAALPDGFTADATAVETRQDDQPIAAADCRDKLQAVLQTGRIAFDGAQAEIAGDSVGVLDRVSAVVTRCPDTAIEVGAYSDSEGSASRNRDRTQARADAIVDFLVSAGVKRERLTAVGYGEQNPIADNSTKEGKAANQRIEFSVALPDGG